MGLKLIYVLCLSSAFGCMVRKEEFGKTGYRLKNGIIATYRNYGFIQCAKICKNTNGCLAFNYHTQLFVCELLPFTHDLFGMPLLMEAKEYVYSEIHWWKKVQLTSLGSQCRECHRGVELTNGGISCDDVGLSIIEMPVSLSNGRMTSQSSTFLPYNSSLAVNDNTADFIQTAGYEDRPYWYVDVGTPVPISKIEIHSRDNYGSKLQNINVTVGHYLHNMTICGALVLPTNDTLISLICAPRIIGNYIKLTVVSGTNNILSFSEIKAFAGICVNSTSTTSTSG